MQPSLINLRISVAPRLERRIAHRWLYWEPFVIRHCRQMFMQMALDDILPKFRTEHRERILQCMAQNISWTKIVNRRLDDPMAPYAAFLYRKGALHAHSSRNGSKQSTQRNGSEGSAPH